MIRNEADLTEYLVSYARDVAFGDEDPGVLLDRHHTPDVTWMNDGVRLDRERLIAHARPARKNVIDCTVQVHAALVSGPRIAARYTLAARMRNDRSVTTEIIMVGELAADGRISHIDQLMRPVP